MRGGTGGPARAVEEEPAVVVFQTQKDGFLRQFSAVFADLYSKRIVTTQRTRW